MSEEVFVFPQGQKVANISLELLRESSMLRASGTNNPGPTRPLQSWELIDNVSQAIAEQKLEFERKEIWVEQKASNRILTAEEMEIYTPDNTPINKWMFDHVLTKIEIVPKKNERQGFRPSIAFSFNQAGIKVVWGLHVSVCQNLCIFGENHISTYGKMKIPFGKQMELLNHWIQNIGAKYQSDLLIMDKMIHTPVNEAWINESIGDLYRMAIKKAYSKGTDAPLNTANLSTLTRNLNTEDISTVWDFYNAGTQIIKPGNIFIEDVLDVNISWGKYLAEKVEF